ncbi:phospholipase C type enzyme [Ceratobasidium sp. 394]|nr:phospholipase C type enzyme [Ceratobasidium sp. 394]
MVVLRLVLSFLSTAALAAAAPTQAVFGLANSGVVERVPTQATISQAASNITANNDHDESRIRVLTLNCWGLRFVSQHRLARITAIAERILTAAPVYDIVALQELWLKSDHALVAAAVAPVLPHSTVFYSGAFGSGLSLFSRFPIEQAQMHPFALAGDPVDVLGGDWFVGKGVAAATQESATSALAAIHEHGVTADSPLNSWSAGKPLDAVARRHLGKRLDYVLYRGPDAQVGWDLVAQEAKVVMTERMPDLGVSLSDHFGVEVELVLTPSGVSTSNAAEFEVADTPLPPLPIPPPIARTRALILHDTLHVLHAAIPASYAASTAYLTTGLACAFSLLALAVAAGAIGWGPNVQSRRGQSRQREHPTATRSPVRAERKQRPRAHTTGSPSSPPLDSTPTSSPSPPQSPLDAPATFRLPLPFLPPKSAWSAKRPIQAPWWLGIVLVLAGALLAAAGTTLLYAAVLFGRWERNAIWDVIDQMERVQARGGIGL